MNWCRDLYVGPAAAGNLEELKKEVEEGRCGPEIQVITLSYNGKDNLDIRPALSMSVHPYLKESGPLIVGIAASRKEARELVEHMAGDCVLSTGDADLRSFFLRTGRSI